MTVIFGTPITAMSTKDERFFRNLSARIAQLRKDQDMTQTQLAECRGIAQRTLAHSEVGRLRVAASMLPTLAQVLGTTALNLVAPATPAAEAKKPNARERARA